MRADQLEKMRALQEQLADVFIEEADPKGWPDTKTRDSRGDRYWMKKNANASLALIGRIENLLALRDGRASGGLGNNPEDAARKADEAKLDDEIAAAEREAERLGRNVVGIHRAKKKR